MNTFTKSELAKLPKWAREKAERLEQRAMRLETELDQARRGVLGDAPGSGLCLHHYGQGQVPIGSAWRLRWYHPTRYPAGVPYLEIGLESDPRRGQGLSIRAGLGNSLAVRPEASNSIVVSPWED